MFERILTRREAELIGDVARFIEGKHRDRKAHDYAHVLTVVNYAVKIGNAIPDEVDPFVLICGAFFHDIGWIGATSGELHGLRGATIADEYFASTWVAPATVERIKGIIVRHTVTSGLSPQTVEEKIVWDADGLAGLGLIGVLRGIIGGAGSTPEILEAALRYAGKHFDRLHFNESHQFDDKLYTETQEIIDYFQAGLTRRKDRIAELDLPYSRSTDGSVA